LTCICEISTFLILHRLLLSATNISWFLFVFIHGDYVDYNSSSQWFQFKLYLCYYIRTLFTTLFKAPCSAPNPFIMFYYYSLIHRSSRLSQSIKTLVLSFLQCRTQGHSILFIIKYILLVWVYIKIIISIVLVIFVSESPFY